MVMFYQFFIAFYGHIPVKHIPYTVEHSEPNPSNPLEFYLRYLQNSIAESSDL